MKVILVRHGNYEGNNKKSFSLNTRLTNLGREQINKTTCELLNIVKNKNFLIVSSPLLRALETADIISDVLYKSHNGGKIKYKIYKDLEEFRMNKPELVTYDTFVEAVTTKSDLYSCENKETLIDRFKTCILDITDDNSMIDYLIVATHGNAIMSMLSHINNKPFTDYSPKNGEYFITKSII